jgi:hypothetical protein
MVSVGIAGISWDAWSGAPQFPQNRVSEGLSKWHDGHFMIRVSLFQRMIQSASAGFHGPYSLFEGLAKEYQF